MADLIPYPLARLARRMFRELHERRSIFDLPSHKFFLGDPSHDLSVRFHDQAVSSPLGPSAGPQSQMAQNIVLAWLGGSRIMELKTVQILDELDIPRPCIDAQTVCYNIEWSQELRLEQSLVEYVKASMLIDILVASGRLELAPRFDRVIYDMSVGYDLAGIRTPRVGAFIEGMKDATPIVDRLRGELTDDLAAYRDLDFRTDLSGSLTLSTFHGCPPEEIEQIIDFLLREHRLDCIIKLNPTLLGPDRVAHLVHGTMGYTDVITPRAAFDKDTTWDQMIGFVDRLGTTAQHLGLGLGVKFSNTLIVRNHRSFFPDTEQEMYLSGQPLHVLAMHLVRDFRRHFKSRYPISFSAGIDRHNFANAVAMGLVPVTVCSDLLRPGGYARQRGYFLSLIKRMDELGARTIDELILAAFSATHTAYKTVLESSSPGHDAPPAAAINSLADLYTEADPGTIARCVQAAALINTELAVDQLTADARYRQPANARVPKKIGSRLELFDCITCDKCIPVCPNDANFVLAIEPTQIPSITLTPPAAGTRWIATHRDPIDLAMKHQIANLADFCNECGNCDVFCPEDGGPYILKPRFFASPDAWRSTPTHDGVCFEDDHLARIVHGRFDGVESSIRLDLASPDTLRYWGEGFDLTFDRADPAASASGHAAGPVDLTYAYIMDTLCHAIFAPHAPVTYLNV